MAEKTAKRTVCHVTPSATRGDSDRWQVEHHEGRRKPREPHHTQKEAVSAAREQPRSTSPPTS
ncbi:DUF2188 domain-containing protein [Streptomyces sp. NPDC006265]|uniref:DUF2188 domain-containing protein n=1 Tax=Streptomyces sp. NPDC006265 TaxID=3156740 RepID=UPI0033BBDCF5